MAQVGWMGGEYDRDDDEWTKLPLAQRIVALVAALHTQHTPDWQHAAVREVERELAAEGVVMTAVPKRFMVNLRLEQRALTIEGDLRVSLVSGKGHDSGWSHIREGLQALGFRLDSSEKATAESTESGPGEPGEV